MTYSIQLNAERNTKVTKMNAAVNLGKYSTTVKVTEEDGSEIDNYVIRGYYPSRSRFIVEAIRNT